MKTTSSSAFSNDRPLSSKADDKLNRALFANRVAEVLRKLPKGTSLVVGIHGPWGDGKTTVLNMLQAELEADSSAVTVEFNPWRFTDEASMLAGFFRVLAGVVRAKLTTKGEDIAGWIEKVGRYAAVADDRFGKAADVAATKSDTSLEELRSRLSEALSRADKRIVVLVDDIDRLDKHETHTLFRLVKACADFPNVCYVLAFDDVAVARSLGERYGGGDEASGRAFLEKIIQVPLKLPVAMKEDLRSLCFRQVEEVLAVSGIELSEKDISAFVSGFDRGVAIRLDTPRAAKRYGNGLMFALPMLQGEINVVDLLLIEAVRAFFPAVYDLIRANHEEFSGVEAEYGIRSHDGPRGASILKSAVDSLPSEEQKAIKSLLNRLFPRLGTVYGSGGYGSNWLTPWAQAKRICSPDYCPRYFSYSVPNSDVRDSDIVRLYADAARKPLIEVGNAIAVFFTGGKARRLIQRLRQQEETTSPDVVESLCVAIAANSKHIPNPQSLFSVANPMSQAAILVSQLVKRLPAGAARVALAKKIIEAADPLWFGDQVLRWLHVTDDADKSESNTLTKSELDQIRKVLVGRIKLRAISGNQLFNVDSQEEQGLLFEWWRVEGRAPVQQHLSSVFAKDPKSIGQFLQAMAPNSWGEDDVLPRVGALGGNELKNIKLIYDLDALAALIREHLPGNFMNLEEFPYSGESVERRLAEQFMYVYNRWKQEGEPPDQTQPTESTSAPEEEEI